MIPSSYSDLSNQAQKMGASATKILQRQEAHKTFAGAKFTDIIGMKPESTKGKMLQALAEKIGGVIYEKFFKANDDKISKSLFKEIIANLKTPDMEKEINTIKGKLAEPKEAAKAVDELNNILLDITLKKVSMKALGLTTTEDDTEAALKDRQAKVEELIKQFEEKIPAKEVVTAGIQGIPMPATQLTEKLSKLHVGYDTLEKNLAEHFGKTVVSSNESNILLGQIQELQADLKELDQDSMNPSLADVIERQALIKRDQVISEFVKFIGTAVLDSKEKEELQSNLKKLSTVSDDQPVKGDPTLKEVIDLCDFISKKGNLPADKNVKRQQLEKLFKDDTKLKMIQSEIKNFNNGQLKVLQELAEKDSSHSLQLLAKNIGLTFDIRLLNNKKFNPKPTQETEILEFRNRYQPLENSLKSHRQLSEINLEQFSPKELKTLNSALVYTFSRGEMPSELEEFMEKVAGKVPKEEAE